MMKIIHFGGKTLGETNQNKSEKVSKPKKYIKEDNIHYYDETFARHLNTKYLETEVDFRTVKGKLDPKEIEKNLVIINCIGKLLHLAKQELYKTEEKPDLLMVSSTLDLGDRLLIWIYPNDILKNVATTTLIHLESYHPTGWAQYIDQIKAQKDDLDSLRRVLNEANRASDMQTIQRQINNNLQIKRLRMLLHLGMALLILFLIGSPLIANLSDSNNWTAHLFLEIPIISIWVNALGISIVGAIGGFLSGLFQVRSSNITLSEYRENMLKLKLKPLVGAIVGLLLYIFLSWNILPGIEITNSGSYFFIAFLSGFSERYFLQLLEIQSNNEEVSKGIDTTKLKSKYDTRD